jgi:hypothetical protein
MNDEFEGMWKEVVVAYFKILSRHLCGRIEEAREKSQDIRYHGRDSNQILPEYNAEPFVSDLSCSI